jgi:hypothetical protein
LHVGRAALDAGDIAFTGASISSDEGNNFCLDVVMPSVVSNDDPVMSEHWRSDLGALGFLMTVMVIVFLATLWASHH